jgi:glycosyltransferase involved in cell wall biosynthesis
MSRRPPPPLVSVVSPVHNEEVNLEEFHRRVSETLCRHGVSYELIIVDDGSDDASPLLLRRLAAADPHLTVLRFARNTGQWAAVYAGLQESRGDFVVVLDSDLQHAPEEIPLLVDKAREGYDLVSGWRQRRRDSWLSRRLPSAVANFLIRRVSGCRVHDMGGFKCLSGDWARRLQLTRGGHRLLPALVHLEGGAVAEVPISAPARRRGESHYGLARTFDVVLDVLSLWFQAAYLASPLHLLGRVAAVLVGGGFATLLWLLYDKLVHGLPMGTRPPLALATLAILIGLLSLLLGFLAEISSRTFYSIGGRRPYHVRERIRGGQAAEAGEAPDTPSPEAGRFGRPAG